MKKILILLMFFALNACTTKYILMDEEGNPVREGYYTENTQDSSTSIANTEILRNQDSKETALANNIFIVKEGYDFITYQYKNVRVDEISPLASLYCADTSFGGSSYLREVSRDNNGFMRATFDCLSIAI